MMNKNENTVDKLGKLLVEIGKRKHGSEHGLNYCFAFGTMQGMFESARWGYESVQEIIDRGIKNAEEELAK